MRECQQFWSLQWFVNKDGRPQLFSYRQSLVGTYADMKDCIVGKSPHFAQEGEIIDEADCCRVFNTEFSDSWEDAKKHYCPGTIIPFRVIANGESIYRHEGMEGLERWIKENVKR